MPDVFVSEENNLPEEKPVKPPHDTPSQKINNTPLLSPSTPLPFLSAYCHNPQGITFKNQEHDEHIVLFLRRHSIRNVSWFTSGIMLLLLPALLVFALDFFETIQTVIPLKFIIVFIAFYYLIIVGFLFVNFISWFYNVGIITTKQIIDIDFTDIMYREVAKARIEDIIDVEFNQGGFLHSFFDYGNVFIQTEGVKPNFEFQTIPHPDKTTDIILDLKGHNPND